MSLEDRLIARVTRRPPDFVIGGPDRPYLRRWWLTPWSRWGRDNPTTRLQRIGSALARLLPSAYLHQFLRSDDDRALHDHPWSSLSILLRGYYVEHTIAAGGIRHERLLVTGDWRLRLSGRLAHRVELPHGEPCWTLFVIGPKYRAWGFHCPDEGWIPWQRFTAPDDKGAVGPGCAG